MSDELYLFPDTNLFDECKPLQEIDWNLIASKDQTIHLVVCRPAQAEIDYQKDRGYDRIGKRARIASALFREILRSDDGNKVIRSDSPRVTIEIRQDIQPNPKLAGQLLYTEKDDALVGTAHAFSVANPAFDVRVLTHDTGPMASAKMVGQKWVEIPDDWLLPPETNETEKKLANVQQELLRLKKAEPEFEINFERGENKAEKFEGDIIIFPPLNESQIEKLIDVLRSKFPVKTDFPPQQNMEHDNIFSVAWSKMPPSEKQIARYQQNEYPNWLESCRKFLSGVHQKFQYKEKSTEFAFKVRNVGTRPGKSSLVTINALGNFQLWVSERYKEKLPLPPEPPMGMIDMARRRDVSRTESLLRSLPELHRQPQAREPEEFYFKRVLREPGQTMEFECEQWRHGVADEGFAGEIWPGDANPEQLVGALECIIRAENLSQAARLTIPVRARVVPGDTVKRATEFIEARTKGNVSGE